MGLFKKRRLKKLAKQQEKQAMMQKAAEPVVVEEKKPEPQKQAPVVEKKVEPASKVVEKKSEPAKTNVLEPSEKKQEPKKVVVEKKIEVPVQEDVKKDLKAAKYHVSQNKDPRSESYRKWRVRKEGSNKTIKFFDTQKQAIEYAESLANTAGSSVVIHKMDGSIRKQDYAKKD